MKNMSEIIKTSTVAFVARKNGVECPFVHLTEQFSVIRDFLAYAVMERDFCSAKELFLESQQRISLPTIYGSLISEGILSYSRPFKPGNQRSIRKLDPKEIFTDQASLDVHNQLQVLRDKFYAHTDENPYEDILLCVALDPDPSNRAILDIYRGMPRSVGFESATVNNFVYVTNKALDWIDTKLNLEHKKVLEELNKIDIAELYRASIDPNKYDQSVRKFYLEYPFT